MSKLPTKFVIAFLAIGTLVGAATIATAMVVGVFDHNHTAFAKPGNPGSHGGGNGGHVGSGSGGGSCSSANNPHCITNSTA